ncbi:MAG: NPCBM/NEW2 domain-containing protein [Armatimonadota bacterium]
MGLSQIAGAVEPSSSEMQTARKWVDAAFDGTDVKAPATGLDVQQNWGAVQKNGRYGKPMRIAGTRYDRGLYCHAPSKVVVRLPKPGKTFSALIGVDDAIQWDVRDFQSGPLWPEVIFTVNAGGKELFKSATMKNAMPAVPVNVDLGGAKEFTIEVTGVRRTQSTVEYLMTEEQKKAAKKAKNPEVSDWGGANWADAKVTFADGGDQYLDDMTLPSNIVKTDTSLPPFSFTYGKKHSSAFINDWKCERTSKKLDADRIQRTLTYTDPGTDLVVRCQGIEYKDYPTVEWTVYFKNTGKGDTPLISNIKALDMQVNRGPDSEFILHHSLGSSCRADDFRPMETVLRPGSEKRFAPVTGYSSDPDMPYFNVESGSGEGLIVVVGWPGQWSAEFSRDKGDGLSINAGQEITRFKLHPGEEIRTPLIVLQFWQGDYIRSQNVWRRWMMAHSMPRPGGKPIEPIMVAGNWGPMNYTGTTEQNQKEFIDRYAEEGIKLNWWWIDFGWHEGTWQPAKERFPNGFKPVTDYNHARDIKTLVWFAPEHSPMGGDPKWLLKGIGEEPLPRGTEISNLDLGNPEAWKWLVEMVDETIVKGNLDCYRHDTSWGPLPTWRKHDTKDRQGITEIRYVEGFLNFYDELLRRHPNLMIDNCCRGGRRNDIETMRRSVPLWRSDYFAEPVSQQSHTYGLSLWLPFFGIGVVDTNPYVFRSCMTPSTHICYDMRNKLVDYDMMRKITREWWEISDNYLGDYYPLTPYSIETGDWMAWQFNTPETGEGFVQVFRRAGDVHDGIYTDTMFLKLNGLEPDAVYTVKNMDVEGTVDYNGRDLMSKGIKVKIETIPQALIFSYKKK